MLNEPAALQVLAKVVQNEAGSKVAPAQPPKSKKNKSKDEETDASNLTRLLVCGGSTSSYYVPGQSVGGAD